ncbi:MAG: precorrin-6A reductase [Propionibacteriaceae bacterium]|jgi:precorrin-6Y C5,15-methyltransferase (decarboxylating)|nr:precorrin-6A reductase [Propionibacteriaceae bacterium]
MYDLVLFGGTTEGRRLTEFCAKARLSTLLCTATELGQQTVASSPHIAGRVGRLDRHGMAAVLREAAPKLVVDATHPYAAAVTCNLAAVCASLGLPYLRVNRPPDPTAAGVRRFDGLAALADWLNQTDGVVFAAMGAKAAAALTRVAGFKDRVVLRLLPLPENLQACLALGYPSAHLVALHGPFDRSLNVALFRHFDAKILVSKESGAAGGFSDKLAAAQDCNMSCALLSRPADEAGVSLEAAERLIAEAVRGR